MKEEVLKSMLKTRGDIPRAKTRLKDGTRGDVTGKVIRGIVRPGHLCWDPEGGGGKMTQSKDRMVLAKITRRYQSALTAGEDIFWGEKRDMTKHFFPGKRR